MKLSFSKKYKYGIICHDAGGAEIISSLLLAEKLNYKVYLEGPAIKVFKEKKVNSENTELNKLIEESDIFILGTSWQSDLEYNVINLIKNNNKYIISILDHWTNYLSRFTRNNILSLPNEIAVCDSYAMEISIKEFKNFDLKISLIQNYYFNEIINKNDNYEPIQIQFDYLYICEPISLPLLMSHKGLKFYDFDEFYILNDFLNGIDKKSKILIRLHPSEEKDKYIKVLEQSERNFTISENTSLLYDIKSSKNIYGWCSMALIVAKVLKKNVLFFNPLQNPCILNTVINKLF
jgi:hypothetical protein